MSERKPTDKRDDLEPVGFLETQTAPPPSPATVRPTAELAEDNGKTREKTRALVAPAHAAGMPRPDLFNGAPLVPGNPGNSGGKPGRSGRPPKDFLAWCQQMIDDPEARDVFLARLKAGDIDVLKFAAAYARGKPRETIEVSGPNGGPIEQEWVIGTRRIKF